MQNRPKIKKKKNSLIVIIQMELVIWNKYDQIVNVIIVLDYNKSTGQKKKEKHIVKILSHSF